MADNENLPKWVQNKLKYTKNYNLENNFTISCKLNKKTHAELIDCWGKIPNKTKFIKESLEIYSKTHGFKDIKEYLEDEDDDR